MRFLLTAFEPFDGTGLNSSLEGCGEFLGRWGSEFDLHFALLPVEYDADTQAVEHALERRPVDVLLHTGQASRCQEVRVERLAVNVRWVRGPGGTGNLEPEMWEQQRIEEDGPAGLFSTLPVDALAAGIRTEGVPAAVSNHAGIYLCNHVLYRSLRRAELQGGRVGFLHFPRLPAQAGPGDPAMTAGDIARAIRAALFYLVQV